jgi:hypothetical protein
MTTGMVLLLIFTAILASFMIRDCYRDLTDRW